MNADAEHVVLVAHHRAAFGVAYFALIAFDVEQDACGEEQALAGLRRIGAVVGDGQECAAQRIEMRDGWGVGVRYGFCAASRSASPS